MDSAQGPTTSELEQAHITPQFGASTALSEKLLAVAIRAQNFTGSTGVAIALTEGQDIVCRANWGTSAPEVGTRLSLEHSFTGLCVRTGEPLRCDDAETDPRVDAEACRALGISAIATAPVRRGLKVIGVIAAFSDTPKAFTEKHLLILTTLSEVIVELLDRPEPSKPSPAEVETAPALARAAGVAQARFMSLGNRANVETTVVGSRSSDLKLLEGSAPPVAAVEAVQSKSEAAVPLREPAVSASIKPAPAPSVAAPVIPMRTGPAPITTFGSAAAMGTSDDDILPAAMDPGPLQPLRTSTPSPGPILLTPSAEDGTFTFRSFGPSSSLHRWIIPAAVLAAILIVIGSWRLISASRARHGAAVTVQEPQPAALASPSQDVAPSQPAAQEIKQSPFSPPVIMSVGSPAKAKPPRIEAGDVTVRREKEPVVQSAGTLRRLKQLPPAAPVAETAPPQLALSTSELPAAVAKPVPSAITPPVSRVVSAQLLSRVEPIYPDPARRMRLAGKVIVKATISRTGTVTNVRWISGNDLFHDTTVTAVRQWRYKPATLNGQPVESDLDIVLQFNPPNYQSHPQR